MNQMEAQATKVQEGLARIVGQQAAEVSNVMLVGEIDAARAMLRGYNTGRNKETFIPPEEAKIDLGNAVGPICWRIWQMFPPYFLVTHGQALMYREHVMKALLEAILFKRNLRQCIPMYSILLQ